MNRLRAILMIVFSPHYLVYTRRGSASCMHHREMGLGDTMKVIEGANEIEEELIQMEENEIAAYSIANGHDF